MVRLCIPGHRCAPTRRCVPACAEHRQREPMRIALSLTSALVLLANSPAHAASAAPPSLEEQRRAVDAQTRNLESLLQQQREKVTPSTSTTVRSHKMWTIRKHCFFAFYDALLSFTGFIAVTE
jgi:hypothetical protein